ncbi:MAG TPA: alpha/beta hydrolase [Candidatus Binatia bacterium]|nr:alpha/beta hydrolase [Candidatus Binatia bacterium]
MATFVLVHGAWHGGWCWRRVADRLVARGHRVFAPTLTGLGERSHLADREIRLSTHIDDIVNLVRWERLDDIVLVGHSYGGIVISGVAEKIEKATRSIVFLDAFVPENGQTMRDVVPAASVARWNEHLSQDGRWITPIPAAVFKVIDEADRAWVDNLCLPHPYATFVDPIALSGARDRILKKTYIRATIYDSPAFRASYDRLKRDPSWRVFEVESGHDVMVDAPDRLARILEEVA